MVGNLVSSNHSPLCYELHATMSFHQTSISLLTYIDSCAEGKFLDEELAQ